MSVAFFANTTERQENLESKKPSTYATAFVLEQLQRVSFIIKKKKRRKWSQIIVQKCVHHEYNMTINYLEKFRFPT